MQYRTEIHNETYMSSYTGRWFAVGAVVAPVGELATAVAGFVGLPFAAVAELAVVVVAAETG